jgi:hypothetical protein
VSIGWQIVFTFITGLNFWAFYRIRKLRKYLLYIIVPEIVMTVVFMAYLSAISTDEVAFKSSDLAPEVNEQGQLQSRFERQEIIPDVLYAYYPMVAVMAVSLGLQGFTIYLVIIWSKEHNKAFDAPSPGSPGS